MTRMAVAPLAFLVVPFAVEAQSPRRSSAPTLVVVRVLGDAEDAQP